jgi:CBS domain-containing protein
MSARRAGAAMVKSGFRHLVVIEGGEVAGLLSMRDIVRVWADAAAPVTQAQAAAPA